MVFLTVYVNDYIIDIELRF